MDRDSGLSSDIYNGSSGDDSFVSERGSKRRRVSPELVEQAPTTHLPTSELTEFVPGTSLTEDNIDLGNSDLELTEVEFDDLRAELSEAEQRQAEESEAHERRVLLGLCWQESAGLEPLPDSSVSLVESPLPSGTMWSGYQKAQFFELLGRRTAADLPRIASIVGKSLMECQVYLEVLQRESSKYPNLDYAEVPAAEEVPDEAIEPSLPQAGDDFGVLDNDKDCLFVLEHLERYAGPALSDGTVRGLTNALRARLKIWITVIIRQLPAAKCSISRDYLKYVVHTNPEVFPGVRLREDSLEAANLKKPRDQSAKSGEDNGPQNASFFPTPLVKEELDFKPPEYTSIVIPPSLLKYESRPLGLREDEIAMTDYEEGDEDRNIDELHEEESKWLDSFDLSKHTVSLTAAQDSLKAAAAISPSQSPQRESSSAFPSYPPRSTELKAFMSTWH